MKVRSSVIMGRFIEMIDAQDQYTLLFLIARRSYIAASTPSQLQSDMTTAPSLPHPFHLAFPVHDLAVARAFYGDLLGCPEGRSSDQWVDFDFHGHQIVAHLAPDEC